MRPTGPSGGPAHAPGRRAPAPPSSDAEVLAATRRVAAELLRPLAERTARDGVPRSHLDALADAGAFGLALRAPGVLRDAVEAVSAADGATWFVYAQHHRPLRAVAASDNRELREHRLAPLRTGRVLCGHAVSHLARPGPPLLTATPDGAGGWRVSGRIPWLTGWGLVDAVLLGASTPDQRIMFALLSSAELADAGTVRPHDLWSMNATYAVSLHLTELRVEPPQVVSLRPAAPWLREHHAQSANAHPALFGNLHATTAFLGAHEPFTAWAAQATRRAAELRTRAYALTDHQPPAEALAERLAVRAAAVDLALRAATACVIASGAQAMTRGAAAARLLAEASFHAVHGQAGAARQAYAEASSRARAEP